jgi:uncharacterized protein YdhG (YjbR/CyaY superfamily)
MMKAAESVEAYLAPLPDTQRVALERLRAQILSVVPDAEECISYGIPTFKLRGKNLVHMGASAKHCSFYPGSGPIEAFADELAGYSTSKGTIRFDPAKPLPAVLVKKIVKWQLKRLSAKA